MEGYNIISSAVAAEAKTKSFTPPMIYFLDGPGMNEEEWTEFKKALHEVVQRQIKRRKKRALRAPVIIEKPAEDGEGEKAPKEEPKEKGK